MHLQTVHRSTHIPYLACPGARLKVRFVPHIERQCELSTQTRSQRTNTTRKRSLRYRKLWRFLQIQVDEQLTTRPTPFDSLNTQVGETIDGLLRNRDHHHMNTSGAPQIQERFGNMTGVEFSVRGAMWASPVKLSMRNMLRCQLTITSVLTRTSTLGAIMTLRLVSNFSSTSKTRQLMDTVRNVTKNSKGRLNSATTGSTVKPTSSVPRAIWASTTRTGSVHMWPSAISIGTASFAILSSRRGMNSYIISALATFTAQIALRSSPTNQCLTSIRNCTMAIDTVVYAASSSLVKRIDSSMPTTCQGTSLVLAAIWSSLPNITCSFIGILATTRSARRADYSHSRLLNSFKITWERAKTISGARNATRISLQMLHESCTSSIAPTIAGARSVKRNSILIDPLLHIMRPNIAGAQDVRSISMITNICKINMEAWRMLRIQSICSAQHVQPR